MSDISNSFAPLIPGTPGQLAARRSAMRALVNAVSESLSRGTTTVPTAALDDLTASFPIPVVIEIDWDRSRSEGHPMIRIRTSTAARDRLLERLSPRQQSVVRLLEEGLTNADIAVRLGISIATVKDHVHDVLSQTGFKRRAALVAALRGPRS
jgi:two-component system, NarL family, nitrate/nitrite response regulator NarL